jgi:hypothetical protein
VGQSGKDPTSLADVTEPVGGTEPKLGEALARFASGMKAIRSELGEMVAAFKAAAPETSRGRGVASVLRVLQGIEPMLKSAEAVATRALGTRSKYVEDAARVVDIVRALDEEPLTWTTDADRSSEPRRKLDLASRVVVDRVVDELGKMRERVRDLGYELQGVAVGVGIGVGVGVAVGVGVLAGSVCSISKLPASQAPLAGDGRGRARWSSLTGLPE